MDILIERCVLDAAGTVRQYVSVPIETARRVTQQSDSVLETNYLWLERLRHFSPPPVDQSEPNLAVIACAINTIVHYPICEVLAHANMPTTTLTLSRPHSIWTEFCIEGKRILSGHVRSSERHMDMYSAAGELAYIGYIATGLQVQFFVFNRNQNICISPAYKLWEQDDVLCAAMAAVRVASLLAQAAGKFSALSTTMADLGLESSIDAPVFAWNYFESRMRNFDQVVSAWTHLHAQNADFAFDTWPERLHVATLHKLNRLQRCPRNWKNVLAALRAIAHDLVRLHSIGLVHTRVFWSSVHTNSTTRYYLLNLDHVMRSTTYLADWRQFLCLLRRAPASLSAEPLLKKIAQFVTSNAKDGAKICAFLDAL